jgi:hypothetical protein
LNALLSARTAEEAEEFANFPLIESARFFANRLCASARHTEINEPTLRAAGIPTSRQEE